MARRECAMAAGPVKKVIPGISPPTGTVTPPSWTHRVNSQCYMVGPHTSPAYPEFWARSIAGRWRKIEELCILDLDPTERTASLRSLGSPLRCDEPIVSRRVDVGGIAVRRMTVTVAIRWITVTVAIRWITVTVAIRWITVTVAI